MATDQTFKINPIPNSLLGNSSPVTGTSTGAINMNTTTNLTGSNTNTNSLFNTSQPLSLTPTTPFSGSIKTTIPTVQQPVPGISGATQTVPNPLFSAKPITQASPSQIGVSAPSYLPPAPGNTSQPSPTVTTTPPVINPPTTVPKPTFNIDTTTVPSNILGSTTTPNSVLDYRNQLQQQQDAYQQSIQQAQQVLYGTQQAAVQAGLYSPAEIAALQQQIQDNQAYRQGTLNIRGQVEPMEFQAGQQQQLDLQHQLTSQADTENAALQEQLRQNNLQAAQTNAQYSQQNYQNAFQQFQQYQTNAIAQGNLGIAGQNSTYGRYDYQQITDPNTGLPTIVTIDKTTGQPIGSYAPGTTSVQQPSNIGTQTNNPTLAFSNALVGQESGGNYGAVSPSGALGKYQIMPGTLQGLGYNVSAQQFLSNPQLQDQAFSTLIGQLSQQYGGDPVKMAAAYYGGAQGAAVVGTPAGDVPQKGGMPSINQYVNSVLQKTQSALGSGQNPPPGTAPDNSASIDALKAQLPIPAQNGVRQTTSGVPYIDLGEVPSTYQGAATIQAAKLGIKAFTAEQAQGIQALDTISQSLNQMTILATQNLNQANGGVGTATNAVKNYIGSTLGTNPALADFGINKDSAIKAVTALAGGTGSGLRINTGTIDAAVSNLPTMYDSREVALEKINKTRDLLNIQLGTAFGNPALGNGVVQYDGHSYNTGDVVSNAQGQLGVVNADGSITPQ